MIGFRLHYTYGTLRFISLIADIFVIFNAKELRLMDPDEDTDAKDEGKEKNGTKKCGKDEIGDRDSKMPLVPEDNFGAKNPENYIGSHTEKAQYKPINETSDLSRNVAPVQLHGGRGAELGIDEDILKSSNYIPIAGPIAEL